MKSNVAKLITKKGMPVAIELDGHRIEYVSQASVIFNAGDHLKVRFDVYCSEVQHEELGDKENSNAS